MSRIAGVRSSVSYTALPVGARLAREEALEDAKSFAGKPRSYKGCGVYQRDFGFFTSIRRKWHVTSSRS
ncbi:hypothetical protein C1X34_07290 [Pseudomonas sp. GW456-12-10-14-TSB6]|nr:hypothetical protein C1X56_10200 [Pseudomonas sp. GW101-1A09]PMV96776.1 hypothetical protein C1X51_06705 [Pseudomonas sp. FW306-2-2C-B10A]PMW01188.1 hypothetical protein C1X55_06735 [Pseudomonas sp. GW460-C8]PMW21488.1 hypothetical protein C1X40_09530 [Pseudomonas sp. GW456-11-11-14-TSB2]PMW24375.1 hypothetical protein C1X53_10090 [Pseudomonas sp. GW456-E6]PMW36147.1 hypothetical protein C1X48_17095 [Pseudomonas sp. FW305-3-2-15-A-R2A1]PMW41417.1 hypothetical protein C1X45_05820 [Pseudomon